MELGRFEAAGELLKAYDAILIELPELLIAKIKLEILGRQTFHPADTNYKKLQRLYDTRSSKLNDEEIKRLIGDLEKNIGRLLAKNNKIDQAINHYLLASEFAPKNIEYIAQLSYLC